MNSQFQTEAKESTFGHPLANYNALYERFDQSWGAGRAAVFTPFRFLGHFQKNFLPSGLKHTLIPIPRKTIYPIVFNYGIKVFPPWRCTTEFVNLWYSLLFINLWYSSLVFITSSQRSYVSTCTLQGKNITWNIPVQWTGALKNYLPGYKSYMPKLFDFPAICRCVWLVKFLIPKDRRKYIPAGPVQQKSTCPPPKLTSPGHSGSVMFLPCPTHHTVALLHTLGKDQGNMSNSRQQ